MVDNCAIRGVGTSAIIMAESLGPQLSLLSTLLLFVVSSLFSVNNGQSKGYWIKPVDPMTREHTILWLSLCLNSPATTTPLPPVPITDVSIIFSGTATAGESYSLECTVTVTGSTDQPTITWLGPMDNIITSGAVMTGSMSTLTFSPLAASHAGIYTCRATLDSAMAQHPGPSLNVQSEWYYDILLWLSLRF